MKNGETYIGQGDLTDKTNITAHGFGMTSRTDSNGIVTTYMGQWLNGTPTGWGMVIQNNP